MDYGKNKITIHASPNNEEFIFTIVEYHKKQTEPNVETYPFFCIDSKSIPYNIKLGIFQDAIDAPLLTIMREKQFSVYYLKRFD